MIFLVWRNYSTPNSGLTAPNNIYIYIYISLKKKTKTGYFRIINLFPSCFCVSGVNQKHEEKYNRSSSDPMDK